jgi:hypothetical protein
VGVEEPLVVVSAESWVLSVKLQVVGVAGAESRMAEVEPVANWAEGVTDLEHVGVA